MLAAFKPASLACGEQDYIQVARQPLNIPGCYFLIMMDGCSDIAAIMAEYPETVIFRRFDTLHAKVCLFLQAEIARLERELDNIIERTNDYVAMNSGRSQADLDADQGSTYGSETPLEQEYRAKVLEIEHRLSSYCKFGTIILRRSC
jgi:hypothetical protein